MHESNVKSSRPGLVKVCLLLLCLLLGLVSQQAFALIENNLACTATGTTGIIQLGDLAPSTSYTAFHFIRVRFIPGF